jgi:hypothetical protein
MRLEHDLDVLDGEAHGDRKNFSYCENILQDSLHKHSCTKIEHASSKHRYCVVTWTAIWIHLIVAAVHYVFQLSLRSL